MSDKPLIEEAFTQHIGMQLLEVRSGFSRSTLITGPHLINRFGVVHGGALFTLADTGMGAALVPTLGPDEFCATIEMKINYFKPVMRQGLIECTCHLINRGKTIAHLEANIAVGGTLVAKASGNFAIIKRKDAAGAPPEGQGVERRQGRMLGACATRARPLTVNLP